MTPLYSGEIQYRYHADSVKGGPQIVLQLSGREELGAFIGREGRRMMAVFVEIGDDELPVAGNPASAPKSRAREHQSLGENCYWAVLRCSEPVFWDWLNHRFPGGEEIRSADQAAHVIRTVCGVSTRKEFDTNPEGRIAFKRQIRDPWSLHFLAGHA